MELPRQKAREIQFLLLFCFDHSHSDEKDIIPLIGKELKVAKSHILKNLERVHSIQEKAEELDDLLKKEITSYEFTRVHAVERILLRLGAYELFFSDEIPPKVAIAEAIRLSKKFGTPASASFVNAVLDHLYKVEMGKQGNIQEVEEAIDAYNDEETPL